MASVRVNLRVLDRMSKPMPRRVYRQWAEIYRSFSQLRYEKFSRGGGNWVPLSKATLAARRKGKGKGKAAILRNTGSLFNAMSVVYKAAAGQLQQNITNGIIVGYGGPGKHAGGVGRNEQGKFTASKVTVADIAAFHQTGTKRMPARKIIVKPSRKTIKLMERAVLKDRGRRL